MQVLQNNLYKSFPGTKEPKLYPAVTNSLSWWDTNRNTGSSFACACMHKMQMIKGTISSKTRTEWIIPNHRNTSRTQIFSLIWKTRKTSLPCTGYYLSLPARFSPPSACIGPCPAVGFQQPTKPSQAANVGTRDAPRSSHVTGKKW